MPDPLATSISLSVLRKPLEDIYAAAKGPLKRKFKQVAIDVRLKELHKAIGSVQKVKTLWRIDKEVKLRTFYYPSKLWMDMSPRGSRLEMFPRTVDSLGQIPSQRVVIEGTVGQGKSIFLRYLCIKELEARTRVPIFAELRRYNPKSTLKSFLFEAISLYGLPCDEEVFELLAESGRLVLLLDGFDEVDTEAVTQVLTDIEGLAQKYPTLQIVITSRPDSGIERSPHFRVHRLAALHPNDLGPFLVRIVDDHSRIPGILAAIDKSSSDVQSLLQTPLLMTLLVIVYNATQEVPSSLSEFYEVLFLTLLTRHDKSKPGFRRKRATTLGDADLKRLFQAFAYAARQRDSLVLDHHSFESLLARAGEVTGIQCDSDAFINDITKIACLMQQEGFQYHFIHKSVAEFHAACFIRRSSDEAAGKFYSTLRSGRWEKWRQELRFLSEIDRPRYLRLFYVPSLLDAFEEIGVDSERDVGASEETAREFLNRIVLYASGSHTGVSQGRGFAAHEIETRSAHYAIPPFENFQTEVSKKSGKLSLGDLLIKAGKGGLGANAVTRALSDARTALRSARRELELQSKIEDFVQP